MGDEYFVDALVNIDAYVQGGIVVTAASLGLSSITQAFCGGIEEAVSQVPQILITTAGAYTSSSSLTIILHSGTAQLSGVADEGMVRLRVYGLI